VTIQRQCSRTGLGVKIDKIPILATFVAVLTPGGHARTYVAKKLRG